MTSYKQRRMMDIRTRITGKKIQPEDVSSTAYKSAQQYEMNFDFHSDMRLRTSLRRENKASLYDLINS